MGARPHWSYLPASLTFWPASFIASPVFWAALLGASAPFAVASLALSAALSMPPLILSLVSAIVRLLEYEASCNSLSQSYSGATGVPGQAFLNAPALVKLPPQYRVAVGERPRRRVARQAP